MREAFNLLRQSIISVEKDDIDVEDEDGDPGAPGGAGADADAAGLAAALATELHGPTPRGDSPMHEDGTDGAAAGRPTATAAGGRMTISYDRYMTILNQLARRVHAEEAASGAGVEHDELLVWYLEQREAELEDEAALQAERELAGKVLKRMVKVRSRPRLPFPPRCH